MADAHAAGRETLSPSHESVTQRTSAPAARLSLVIGIFLVGINLRPAISSLAPVLASVRAGTGMSSAGAGLLTTLPVLCFGLFAVFVPRLTRRFSPERIVLLALLLLAAGIALRSMAGVPGLFFGTLIAGACISVVMVLLPGIIKQDFPRRINTMMGLYTMALCLGAALAAGATVPIQQLAGGDWRIALAFWLLPALLAAVVWWPQQRGHAAGAARVAHAVRGLLSDRLAWQVTLFMGLQSSLAYIIFGWLPTILIERGMEPRLAGYVLSMSIACQLITAFGGPWLATRGRDQRAAIAAMMTMSMIGYIGCVYAPLSTIWIWGFILGLGQGGAFSIGLTLLVLRSPDSQVAAALSGMAQGFGYTMAASGPFLVGLLHDFSGNWNTASVLFMATGLAALAYGMGAGRDRQVAVRAERME